MSPTCGKDRSSSSQESPMRPLKTTKMWPEDNSDAHFYMSAIFAKIGPKTFQNRQDSSPSGLKMAIWSPTWPILAPSWLHLGAKLANLAPSWPILAPRCAPIAMQMEPQMRSKSRPGPAWRQEGHRGPQKCPWSLNFQRFFIEFWNEFA